MASFLSAGSFVTLLVIAEVAMRFLAPNLPADTKTWPRTEMGQKMEQIQAYEDDDRSANVLFVGSSMMAGGINPNVFSEVAGLESYNAAFAGPSMRTVTPWTLDIVEPRLRPDVVVLGVNSRELNDNGPKHLRMFESFEVSPGYRQNRAGLLNEIQAWLEEHSAFMRYRRLLREPSTLFEQATEGKKQRIRHDIGDRGLRLDEPGNYHFTEKFAASLHREALVDYEVGGEELDALYGLQESLEARGVELIVMEMPVTDDYATVHDDPHGEIAAYDRVMNRFLERTGVTFVDASEAFSSTDSFKDPMHLDVAGRDNLSAFLAERWDTLTGAGDERFELRCRSGATDACSLEPAR